MVDNPVHAFVCGHPIGHSRSPIIHNYWLRKHGIAGTYEPKDVAPENFNAFVQAMRANGFVGGNVTIPFKESAYRLTEKRDEAAETIGAVNTLWFEDGALCGGNTDAYGFAANLDAMAPDWAGAETATVLGAGGAARAVIHALSVRGIPKIRIVNRTIGRAQALANQFGGAAAAYDWGYLPALLTDTDLLINTTSLGMAGAPALDIDLSPLPATAIVSDIVYAPLVTPLLRSAAGRELRTVDGLGMLLHQAVPGFERWFGVRPQVTQELREIILADLEQHQ